MQVFEIVSERVHRNQLQFTPDGRSLMVAANPFILIDTADGSCRTYPEMGSWWAWGLVRNGAAIAYLPPGGGLRVLNLQTREEQTGTIHIDTAREMVADLRGEKLYLTSSAPSQKKNRRIGVYSATDLTPREGFIPLTELVGQLGISADGNWLVARQAYGRNLYVWHVGGEKLPSRESMCVTPAHHVHHFALSADGAHLAAVSSFGLSIWKTNSGERVVHSGKHRRSVNSVACNPAKPILATGDRAGHVFLWDYTGNVLARYDWKLDEVHGLAFAPDGLRCAAVDDTGKVVIWDVDV
jgi:WD40 repeat protein